MQEILQCIDAFAQVPFPLGKVRDIGEGDIRTGDFFVTGVKFTMMKCGLLQFTWTIKPVGLDTWNFTKWIADDVTIPESGTWDDQVYGWDF